MKRPPIIVIMGHVDHGKTTLLDFIKKTNVAAREAGGITQSIGAYEIEHTRSFANTQDDGEGVEKITFIDTPGHEAFSKMRRRGSHIADIAVLVVAADDGVKNQTAESIKIIKETETPFLVAINKIDKPNADVNRVKSELAQEGVALEGFGGDISYQEISAKNGDGVDELLDLILLAADMEELTYDPNLPARGFVLEAKLDSRCGPVASLIIKDGTLKTGDEIVVGAAKAKIKLLENFLGKKINQAEPSAPVLVLGFSQVPEVGAEFIATSHSEVSAKHSTISHSEASAEESKKRLPLRQLADRNDVGNKTPINLILKASDGGSLEALVELIKNVSVPENKYLNIVDRAIGDIGDSNVKLAISAEAIIIGFKVKTDKAAANVARGKVKIITSDIIYKLLEEFEQWLGQSQEAVIVGDLEILAVFGKKSGNRIIGGRVAAGEILNQARCEIKRGNNVIGKCKIINLQKGKADAARVVAGEECGLLVSSDAEIKVGDHLVIYS